MRLPTDKLRLLCFFATLVLLAVGAHTALDVASGYPNPEKHAKTFTALFIAPLVLVSVATLAGKKGIALVAASISLLAGGYGEYLYYNQTSLEDKMLVVAAIRIAYFISLVVALIALVARFQSPKPIYTAPQEPTAGRVSSPRIHMGAAEVDRLRSRARILGWIVPFIAAPPIISILLLSLPIVGNLIMLQLAGQLGCTVNAAQPHPCMLAGHDIGPTVYNYAVGSLFLGLMNPLYLLGAILESNTLRLILIVWLSLVIWLLVMRSSVRGRLRENGSLETW